jgi:pyruvate dehydrogenase complex dehydrogenase (E1) component
MQGRFLEGRITTKQLENFRQEVDGGGLSSYPHPWLMPNYWQFPTVSMGLGPIHGNLSGEIYEIFTKQIFNRRSK